LWRALPIRISCGRGLAKALADDPATRFVQRSSSMWFPRERERGIPMHSAIPSVRLRLPTLVMTLALLALAAQAQTNISGPLSDSTTGPLTAGVYHAVAGISVPSGQILTVHPDAYVKAGRNPGKVPTHAALLRVA